MLNNRELAHLSRIVRDEWPKPQIKPKHGIKRRTYANREVRHGLQARVCAVIEIVAGARGLTVGEITGRLRTQGISEARHICDYIARRLLGASFPELAECFNRDHSTIIHGCNVVEKRMKEYPEYARSIERLVTQAEGQ